MDFQGVVDKINAMACVISVERQEDGSCGTIRIVAGNQAYVASIEVEDDIHPKMLTDCFVPNREYQNYFSRDLNFEDFCYRSAIEKEVLHTYIHPERFDVWMNIMMLPLESDDEKLGYCLYVMEITKEANTQKMSNLSRETAADVLDTCLKLRGAVDFRTTVNEVMADIRRICDARHVCLLLIDQEEQKCTMLGQSYADTARKIDMKHWEDDEHYRIVMSWPAMIGGSTCLIVKNEKDMQLVKEGNPHWYESLCRAQVNSLVLFPLRDRHELLGYIWATNFEVENTVRIKETLEVTSFIMASEISNYLMLNKLHTLSTIDMLTGVYNRNAMNNRVDELSKEEREEEQAEQNGNGLEDQNDQDREEREHHLGVVFADLNGLKRVNDQEGHQAGDLLLKNAAMALQNAFLGDEIYRAGGDEFMILLMGTSPEEIKAKMEHLRKIQNSYGKASFALGYSYQDDARNVREALREADEAMYADKKEFYHEHPQENRVN